MKLFNGPFKWCSPSPDHKHILPTTHYVISNYKSQSQGQLHSAEVHSRGHRLNSTSPPLASSLLLLFSSPPLAFSLFLRSIHCGVCHRARRLAHCFPFVPSTFSPLDAQHPLLFSSSLLFFSPMLSNEDQSHFFPMCVCQRAGFAKHRVPSDIYDQHCLERRRHLPYCHFFASIVVVTYIALSSRQGRSGRQTSAIIKPSTQQTLKMTLTKWPHHAQTGRLKNDTIHPQETWRKYEIVDWECSKLKCSAQCGSRWVCWERVGCSQTHFVLICASAGHHNTTTPNNTAGSRCHAQWGKIDNWKPRSYIFGSAKQPKIWQTHSKSRQKIYVFSTDSKNSGRALGSATTTTMSLWFTRGRGVWSIITLSSVDGTGNDSKKEK